MLTPLAVRVLLGVSAVLLIAALVATILYVGADARADREQLRAESAEAQVELLTELREAEYQARQAVAVAVAEIEQLNRAVQEQADEAKNRGDSGLDAGLDELRRQGAAESSPAAR